MHRVPSRVEAALLLIFLTLAVAGAASAQNFLGETELLPVTHDNVDLTLADGSTYRGGDYGGQHEACGVSQRAFLAWTDPASRSGWHRVRPTGGACRDAAGPPMFQAFTPFDPAHILGSSIRDATVDPGTGGAYTLVDLQVAWTLEEAPGLAQAKGIAVLHWGAGGQLLHQRYFGRLPQGLPPEGINCLNLCDFIGDGDDGPDYGGHAITFGAHGVTVTGWYDPPSESPAPEGREVLAVRFSPDLSTELWAVTGGTAGKDEGLDVDVDVLGRSYIAGFGQADPDRNDRDVLMLRIDTAGQIDRFLTFGGVKDDESESLVITGDTATVEGFFTDQMTVGTQTLGGGGQGQQNFGVTVDQDLKPISAWIAEPAGQGTSAQLPGDDLLKIGRLSPNAFTKSGAESHSATLLDYVVVHGTQMSGDVPQLAVSDNDYLRIVSRPGDYIELLAWFDANPLDDDALYLKTVGWELATPHCYRALVFLHNVRTTGPQLAGNRRVCPIDEARGRVNVAPDLADAMGYDGSQEIDVDEPMALTLRIVFEGGTNGVTGLQLKSASESDKELSIDQVDVEVEY